MELKQTRTRGSGWIIGSIILLKASRLLSIVQYRKRLVVGQETTTIARIEWKEKAP